VNLGTRTSLVIVLLTLTTMLGCSALNASQPLAQQATGLVATAATLDFGTVPVGSTVVRTNTIVNNSGSPVVLTRAQIDQTDFTIAGQKLPLRLAPGERTAVQVVYSPRSGGSSQGRVVFASNVIRSSATFELKGMALVSGRITLNPKSISFGNVQMGMTQTQSATLSNSGIGTVTITHTAISGKGFALTGVRLPLVLRARETATVGVSFTPASDGTNSGTISLLGTTTIRFARRGHRRGEEPPTDVAMTTISTALNVPVSGIGMLNGQLAVSPTVLALGRVKIGASQTQSATLVNSGGSTVTVKHASVSGRGFRMNGLSFPLTLSPGQKKTFSVTFAPQSSGTASGSVAVTSDAPNSVVSLPVSGVAVGSGILISNPSSLSFGSVQVSQPQTLSAALTNSGASSVTVSQASVSGTGFAVGGLSLPVTLAAGQSAAFSVTFNPQSGGAAAGSLSFTSDASNAVLAIPLVATGAGLGSLTSAPSSLNFGSVQVVTPKTVSATLTNAGSSSVTLSQANVTGVGFTVSGLNVPAILAAGQSKTLSVTFTPQSAGSASGSLSIVSDASNTSLAIPLSATTATAGALSTSDSSLDFSSVQVGSTNTLSETLTNTGGANVTVTQANASGTGFRVTGLSLPLTLRAGQSFTFGAVFAPTSGGSATGSISVVSDASNPALTISMAGTATVSGQLAVSPAIMSFGSVTVGQSKSLTASLTASGSSITITDASMSTSEFKVSGLALPVTLAAGKSVSFTVSFAPQSSGAAAASASFTSNASNSSAQQSLTGSGTAALQHSVALSWSPSSSSTVVGYNIYRGVTTGGPYSKINSLNIDTTYTDSSVQAGQTYFYVTTAVDAVGKESANSNQTQAVVPTP